jgi:hypothetical protein
MKIKSMLLMAVVAIFSFASCSKSNNTPSITFTNNIAEGTADNNGDFTITGHISSPSRLEKVTLTKEGQSNAFFVDESTAKNKTEYDFTYPVSNINSNTYIVIDAFNVDGGRTSTRFLIKK